MTAVVIRKLLSLDIIMSGGAMMENVEQELNIVKELEKICGKHRIEELKIIAFQSYLYCKEKRVETQLNKMDD